MIQFILSCQIKKKNHYSLLFIKACGMAIDVLQDQARRKSLASLGPQNMQARPHPLPQLFQPRRFIRSPLLRLPRPPEI